MKYWGCAWYATVQATVDSSLWCHRWHSWDTTWHRRHWVHSWYIIHTGIRRRSRHIVDCISFNPLCKYCMCVCVWEVSVEVSTIQHSIPDTATAALALFSGSCGEKEKNNLVHTVCACTNFSCILTLLHENFRNFRLPSERPHTELYFLWDTFGWFWSRKQYRFDGNCLHCFVQDNLWTSKRNIVSITSQCLAGIDVNGETEHAQTVCTRFFFSAHARTRTWEQGYVQQHMHPLIPYLMYTGNRTGSTVCRLIVFSLHTCLE